MKVVYTANIIQKNTITMINLRTEEQNYRETSYLVAFTGGRVFYVKVKEKGFSIKVEHRSHCPEIRQWSNSAK